MELEDWTEYLTGNGTVIKKFRPSELHLATAGEIAFGLMKIIGRWKGEIWELARKVEAKEADWNSLIKFVQESSCPLWKGVIISARRVLAVSSPVCLVVLSLLLVVKLHYTGQIETKARERLSEPPIIRIKIVEMEKTIPYPILPYSRPVEGEMTSPFGPRIHPMGGGTEFHGGIDIKVPIRTPVLAIGSGRVILAKWMNGSGLTVIIDHKNGVFTCYGHLSRILVWEGKWVKEGEVIAYSGSSGKSTGPHVHYEILIDPQAFLR